MMREGNISGPGIDPGLFPRPLGARSVIASLLMRSQPPRMPGARLVQWCGLFGIREGTARVALSRMVDRGELTASGGSYELAGRVRRRRSEQDWSLDPKFDRWDGAWRLVVVGPGARRPEDRSALRGAMRALRFAPVREGVWTRPDNLPRASAPREVWEVVEDQCQTWAGRPDGDARVLAAELFDVQTWADRAEMLTERLRGATNRVRAAGDASLGDAFVAGAASLAHIRIDPLLPRELAPALASGDALRFAYHSYEEAFSKALRSWFATHC